MVYTHHELEIIATAMTAEEKKSPGKDPGKETFKSNKKHGGKSPTSVISLNSDTAVPLLRLGVNNNFDNFKRKVSIACGEVQELRQVDCGQGLL